MFGNGWPLAIFVYLFIFLNKNGKGILSKILMFGDRLKKMWFSVQPHLFPSSVVMSCSEFCCRA
jgi:hypothetical protein